ncbi:MAG: aminoglycoside phosphotransferase family protein [Calditrichaeota bacterium]|nr:MAG: aminoglycoside phosphotransferase family protein [Calditrichota bacterium]
MTNYDLKFIAANFEIEGNFHSAEPFGNGHINDTFLISMAEKNNRHYLLQRINDHVFRNVPQLMQNIENVTRHIRNKIRNIPGADPERNCMTFIPAGNGKPFYQDDDGNLWRACYFIENSFSYDSVKSPEHARQGGLAFGNFQKLLADFPAKLLHETIPNFHNVDVRLESFYRTIKRDPFKRTQAGSKEIRFIENRADEMHHILHLGDKGKIATRITHNDTKFNNVLFDKSGKFLCVIDLDTVMPGYVHYDFGDAIRTGCNTGSEDDPNLEKVELNIIFFEAYTNGFLHETKSFLSTIEIENLAFSAKLLTYIMGLRFLTDYFDGDNYYKIHHKNHNLQRARAQFKLLESMESQYSRMQAIILQQAGLG